MVALKVLQLLMDRISDPGELSLIRETYHAVATGESKSWPVDRPNDITRLRAIFEREFDVPSY